ncbi:hypothetical protein F4775DRAFT_537364 [Biscogniauxia sp. FL1348]|nr:hypothetical protein F4775DRAFT_537364 [Biscogniauxia sp. FL1348]
MSTIDSGGSDRSDVCSSCAQCEICRQEATAAVADTGPRDDSSPPPYERISSRMAQQQQAICYGYNTFADSRSASSQLESEPHGDDESAEQKPQDTDWDECMGMVITAVGGAIIVVGLWYLAFIILNLR